METLERLTISGDAKLHPRLCTMLNMHTGPLALLAETQATLRIPDDVGEHGRLDELYPKARTVADPRSG